MTLDEQIARKVMKWNSVGDRWASGKSHKHRLKKKYSFNPSTDIKDAWSVVEMMGFKYVEVRKTEVETCTEICEMALRFKARNHPSDGSLEDL